jgi:hypothetical protein
MGTQGFGSPALPLSAFHLPPFFSQLGCRVTGVSLPGHTGPLLAKPPLTWVKGWEPGLLGSNVGRGDDGFIRKPLSLAFNPELLPNSKSRLRLGQTLRTPNTHRSGSSEPRSALSLPYTPSADITYITYANRINAYDQSLLYLLVFIQSYVLSIRTINVI